MRVLSASTGHTTAPSWFAELDALHPDFVIHGGATGAEPVGIARIRAWPIRKPGRDNDHVAGM